MRSRCACFTAATLTLFEFATWYTNTGTWLLPLHEDAIIAVPLVAIIILLLYTEFGLLLRATGENWSLVQKLGKPCWFYLLTTLALANGLVGASGGSSQITTALLMLVLAPAP